MHCVRDFGLVIRESLVIGHQSLVIHEGEQCIHELAVTLVFKPASCEVSRPRGPRGKNASELADRNVGVTPRPPTRGCTGRRGASAAILILTRSAPILGAARREIRTRQAIPRRFRFPGPLRPGRPRSTHAKMRLPRFWSRIAPMNRSATFTPPHRSKLLDPLKLKRRERRAPSFRFMGRIAADRLESLHNSFQTRRMFER